MRTLVWPPYALEDENKREGASETRWSFFVSFIVTRLVVVSFLVIRLVVVSFSHHTPTTMSSSTRGSYNPYEQPLSYEPDYGHHQSQEDNSHAHEQPNYHDQQADYSEQYPAGQPYYPAGASYPAPGAATAAVGSVASTLGGSEKDPMRMSMNSAFAPPTAPYPRRSPTPDPQQSDLPIDTTPYGRARHQLLTSYSSFQSLLDKTIPHPVPRWITTALLFVLFWLRIFQAEGFYVVAYTLSIYLLNIFLLFLTPKFMPDDDFDAHAADEPPLPTTTSRGGGDDDFRPFIRRLPEFHFWLNATSSISYGILATLFAIFDIPVFWPILVVYFCALFLFTMRRQIEHMLRHNYIPFDFGKRRFRSARGQ